MTRNAIMFVGYNTMTEMFFVIFLTIFNVSTGQRRIVGGSPVTTDKKYMVYLIKTEADEKQYDAWLCGGALVSPIYIITSAACVTDVVYLYAIAGYKKYVTYEDIEKDECIMNTRKKVIYSIKPESYELDYDKVEKWSNIDIALVQVESPYVPGDKAFAVCDYVPEIIPINYEKKYQEPGIDAVMFGWGHTEIWREPDDPNNYNQQYLRYGSTMIFSKTLCKKFFEFYPDMDYIIDNYMICTLMRGNLNETGDLIKESVKNATGCATPKPRTTPKDENLNKSEEYEYIEETYEGICQNDHGGPLVTWVGAREVVIGIASVFRVDVNRKCIGPYLYTSTFCSAAFLDCTLSANSTRPSKFLRSFCNSPPQIKGYRTIERHISWKEHPDGPAENEINYEHENYFT